MRKIAFMLTIIGIFFLLMFLNFQTPIVVNGYSSLSKLEDNAKVQTHGIVLYERTLYGETKLLKLDNGIEITCKSCLSYINRTLEVIGTIERYQNKTQILALSISTP